MKATHVNEGYAHFDDGTGWPLPERDNEERGGSVQWRLRYGQPSKSDLLAAASVMSAYEALIERTAKRRQEIVMAIRDAVEQRDTLPRCTARGCEKPIRRGTGCGCTDCDHKAEPRHAQCCGGPADA